MVTKKDRRHSGYVAPKPTISKKEIERHGLTIDDFYDDWIDYRDGFRDWFRDFKTIKRIKRSMFNFYSSSAEKRMRMNKKQKLLLQRRKARNKITI